MPYDRDQVVSELLAFYEFLVRMYLPEELLKRPPSGGWPSVTHERFAFMRKSDTVIGLLKHLPYICQDGLSFEPEIYNFCTAFDYTGRSFDRAAKLQSYSTFTPPEPLEDNDLARGLDAIEVGSDGNGPVRGYPPHVVALAYGRDDGPWIWLNTRTGCVWLASLQDFRGFTDIAEFTKTIMDELMNLDVAALEFHDVRYLVDWCQPVADIYRAHGWPQQRYQKAECLANIKEWDEQRSQPRP